MQVLLPSHEAPSPRRGEGDELSFSPSFEGRPGFFHLAPIGERVPEGRVRGCAIHVTESQHRSFALRSVRHRRKTESSRLIYCRFPRFIRRPTARTCREPECRSTGGRRKVWPGDG
jgi:hypothetical protein